MLRALEEEEEEEKKITEGSFVNIIPEHTDAFVPSWHLPQ